MHLHLYFPLKFKYTHLTLTNYFMNAKMFISLPTSHYIKYRARHTLCMVILVNRNREYWTSSAINSIHNKEVWTVLKEMSTVLVLLCIKASQIELKCGIPQNMCSHCTNSSFKNVALDFLSNNTYVFNCACTMHVSSHQLVEHKNVLQMLIFGADASHANY